MKAALIKLAFGVWTALAVRAQRAPDAQAIAEAASQAVLEDAEAGLPPIGTSYDEDLAVQVYWSFRESGLRKNAVGDHGHSIGPWQLQSDCGHKTLVEQARCWRALVRAKDTYCPDAPYAILWGACALDLKPYGSPGWTSKTASLGRVRVARKLLVKALEDDKPEPATLSP